ncbi:MAG TPA: L,D-transpeptidase [Edaphocola sp.]|nr:L,D-transpeptidase [Edaphocola sp.]
MRKILFTIVLVAAVVLPGLLSAQKLNVGNPQQKNQENQRPADQITNYKVIRETKGSDGSITREVEYYKGNIIVHQTLILPPMPKIGYHKPIDPDTMNHDSVLVYIDKANYLLAVIYKRRRIRQYRAVFGPDRLPDKMTEGDRKTPEGWFKIVSKKYDSRWQRFLLLNYPNDSSYARFYRRKRDGEISQNARIGGSIGIHGTYPTGAGMVDLGIGWTDGCISLKPRDIEDLYKLVWPGTRVYIK